MDRRELRQLIARAPLGDVRLPAVVSDPAYFDVGRGVTLDLRGTRELQTRALAGLVRLVRHCGTVRLLLVRQSQPCRLLTQHLGSFVLRPSLHRGEEWTLSVERPREDARCSA